MGVKFVKGTNRMLQRRSAGISVGRDVDTDISDHLGCGVVQFENANLDWKVLHDEYLYCLDGTLTVRADAGLYHLGPNDAIWLPNGTEMTYTSRDHATCVMAVYPNDWPGRAPSVPEEGPR